MDRPALAVLLVRHEGLRQKPYRDTYGHLTIGVGRNLDAKGLSRQEVLYLLDNDITDTWLSCKMIPGFLDLDPVRQHVLMDMVFAMGLAGFQTFQKFQEAIRVQDWSNAARELKESTWARDVGEGRVNYLALMILTGRELHA